MNGVVLLVGGLLLVAVIKLIMHQPRVAVIRVDGFAGRRRDCGTWQFRRLVASESGSDQTGGA